MAEGAPGRPDSAVPIQIPAGVAKASLPAFDGLSRDQKRELAAIVLAGIASALFFLVPLLGAVPRPPLPSSGTIVAIAVVVPPPLSLVPATHIVHRRAERRVLFERAFVTAALSIPRDVRPASRLDEPENMREDGKRTPGALTRVLFGDGRYRVQPFPTVDERD